MRLKTSELLLFAFLSALMLPAFCNAEISASQALDYMAGAGYLATGETVEVYPVTQISYSNNKYWVATVLSGTSITGFIAVNSAAQQPSILESKTANEQLFKTAYFLRFLKSKDESIPSSQWFFTQQNIDFFSSLERVLKQEKESDLSLIISETKTSAVTSKAVAMQQDIDVLRGHCKEISESIADCISSESEFSTNPTPEKSLELLSKFASLKSSVDSLEQSAIDYDSRVSALKKAISDANIELEKKVSLSKLASAPVDFSISTISGKKQYANSSILALQQAYKEAVSNSEVFAASLQSRIKRVKAYSMLYSEDLELKEKTSSYSVLKSAIQDILSESKVRLWENQSEVKKLSTYWANAESGFSKTNYDFAIENAQKARQSVILIVKAGFKDTGPVEPEISTEFFVQAAILVAVILVLIVFIQKILPKLIKPKGQAGDFKDFQEDYNIRR